MLRNFLHYIKAFFARSSQKAAVPHVPAPPFSQQQAPTTSPFSFQGAQPIERHFVRHIIPGTGFELGWQERAMLLGEELVQGREKIHVRLGCDHDVARFDPTLEEGQMLPGIGGTCTFCQKETEKLLKKNKITPQEAETLSLFCSSCRRTCYGCGNTSVCSRHCLPFKDAEGEQRMLCPACQTAAERKKLIRQIFQVVASPFVEPPDSWRSGR